MITATATNAGGSTSEFSKCFALDPPPFVVNSVIDPGDGVCNVSNCTLREAITAANASAAGSYNTIQFNIPGGRPFTISPNPSALPTINRTTLIDGYSQPGASVNTIAEGDDAVIKIRIHGALAGAARGLTVCGPNSTLRGLSLTGFQLQGIDFGSPNVFCSASGGATGSTLEGSFIGLATDGTTISGNLGEGGVQTVGARVHIGGTTPAARNVISGNVTGVAVQNAGSAGTLIEGNYIGTDASGTLNKGNGNRGLDVFIVSGVSVGTESAPNRIAFNGRGITVSNNSALQASMFANDVFSNTLLGIDLNSNGVTPNDPDDADTGPNNLQNFPVLSGAQRLGAGIRISGSLDVPVGTAGNPNSAYTIAIYANAACDLPSLHGEGGRFLGTQAVQLHDNVVLQRETFSFDLVTSDALGPGTQITATATDPAGNTSEFSACFAATDPPPGFVVTSTADTDGTTCGATCTLRQGKGVRALIVCADFPH